MAGSWRGKKPIQRNAIIALANYRDKTALPALLRCIEEDPRPVIRGTAAWAIGQIVAKQDVTVIEFLRTAYQKEEDEEARVEFKQALQTLEEKSS